LPDVIVLNGEEDKVMGIPLEEWFRSKAAFSLGGLVFQYFASWLLNLSTIFVVDVKVVLYL
jgi:hypothetical protein